MKYEGFLNWKSFKMKLIFEGIIVGIFVGLVISLFRFFVDKCGIYLPQIYEYVFGRPVFIVVCIAALVLLGLAMGVLVRLNPMVSGSGIPQVEGVILRKLHMNWFGVVVEKFVGSLVSIGSGLSMGIEGPSVQIGAAIGQGIGTILKKTKVEVKYLVTGGVSAGISTAFNAPLAGTLFAVEEVHKNLSPLVLVSALSSALSSDFVSREFFGMRPVFDFRSTAVLPLRNYPFMIILGLIIGVAGVGFSKGILKSQSIYAKSKMKVEFRPIVPFLLSFLVAMFVPKALGEGNVLITALTHGDWTFKLLFLILIVKFIFTMICVGSGTPGGIFLPLFAVGAIIGCIYANALNYFWGFDQMYVATFVILAMAGYFSAVVKAPITGCVLVVEMTGSFTNLLPAAVISITAYIISDLLRSRPIYQDLLDRFLRSNTNEEEDEDFGDQVTVEVPICVGCYVEGRRIKEVDFPKNCLVLNIKRGDSEIIPDGDTIVYAGDYLTILTEEKKVFKLRERLNEITQVKRKI